MALSENQLAARAWVSQSEDGAHGTAAQIGSIWLERGKQRMMDMRRERDTSWRPKGISRPERISRPAVDDISDHQPHAGRGLGSFESRTVQILLLDLLGPHPPRYHHNDLIRDEMARDWAKRDVRAGRSRINRKRPARQDDIRFLIGFRAYYHPSHSSVMRSMPSSTTV